MRPAIPILLFLFVACTAGNPDTAPNSPQSQPAEAPRQDPAEGPGLAPGATAAAPDVVLSLHNGEKLSLSETKGLVFVYFYPKDDTPGCTVEAQGLRDNYQALTEAGVRVVGVSLQDAESHAAFIEKYELPFPLAVDDGSAAQAFGVPVRGEFAARQSFLLKDGKIVKVWRKVRPEGHAAEVLAAVKKAG